MKEKTTSARDVGGDERSPSVELINPTMHAHPRGARVCSFAPDFDCSVTDDRPG